jgi:hypothetical protein
MFAPTYLVSQPSLLKNSVGPIIPLIVICLANTEDQGRSVVQTTRKSHQSVSSHLTGLVAHLSYYLVRVSRYVEWGAHKCRSALLSTIVMMTSLWAFQQPTLVPPSQSAGRYPWVDWRTGTNHFTSNRDTSPAPHPILSRQFQALFDSHRVSYI